MNYLFYFQTDLEKYNEMLSILYIPEEETGGPNSIVFKNCELLKGNETNKP